MNPRPPSLNPEQRRTLEEIRAFVSTFIQGKSELIDFALVVLLGDGHLLLEDLPGVGKSTLARALASAVGGSFRRIQFTSDLLPADLLGVNIWRAQGEHFEFRAGPIFANIVLADEINRAPPRTQSALLEAMGEGQVSIDGHSHALPTPFTVLATKNPEEQHGTYPLPESQCDRFMLRLRMGYLASDLEANLLQQGGNNNTTAPEPPANGTIEALLELQALTRQIYLHPDLAQYAQSVVQATREDPEIRVGVSTRGALAWTQAARALALLGGRSQVGIDDLQSLAVPALAHRLSLQGRSSGDESRLADERIRELIAAQPVPL